MEPKNLIMILRLTKLYSFLALATIVLLGIFSFTAPGLVSENAWIHASIVAVFAVLLPLRARAAQHGRLNALRATGIIASVLFLVNIVEGLLPNFVPTWMKLDMFTIAALMLGIIGLIIKTNVEDKQ